jgi:hypothetical protein
VVIKDDVHMNKEDLKRHNVREYSEKKMLELENKNKREEYKYCLNQNGQ